MVFSQIAERNELSVANEVGNSQHRLVSDFQESPGVTAGLNTGLAIDVGCTKVERAALSDQSGQIRCQFVLPFATLSHPLVVLARTT